jgi:NADPH-dependent 2,4-dienoyl-CoA reductase/sulfur reductase-like enzyme
MTIKSVDVVVVGGSAAGVTAAITARRHYPSKSVLLVRKEAQVSIPCGIPYICGTVGTPEKNLIPNAVLEKEQVEILVSEATTIDRERKSVVTAAGEVTYDRLIVATGSHPVTPPIPGVEKEGIFTILKDVEHLRKMQDHLKTAHDIVVVGGGFIGIEFADEIRKMGGKTITIVEIAAHCLSLSYDGEFCVEAEQVIRSSGITILTTSKVTGFTGHGHVTGVQLSNGTILKADAVILGTGSKANAELAQAAGLRIGATGGIDVDRAMRTSDRHIFACGDCAEKVSFFGGGHSTLKLASIATSEARIAGANLFGITRENPGTVGVWSTALGDFALGTAGLTETMAKAWGYDTVTATVEGPNRHPGGMPGGAQTKVKLVFECNSGVLLGGQVRGNSAAGEMINAVSACVQRRMTAEDIAMFQMGTHPALTASPIAYPLVNAAELAIKAIRSRKGS